MYVRESDSYHILLLQKFFIKPNFRNGSYQINFYKITFCEYFQLSSHTKKQSILNNKKISQISPT